MKEVKIIGEILEVAQTRGSGSLQSWQDGEHFARQFNGSGTAIRNPSIDADGPSFTVPENTGALRGELPDTAALEAEFANRETAGSIFGGSAWEGNWATLDGSVLSRVHYNNNAPEGEPHGTVNRTENLGIMNLRGCEFGMSGRNKSDHAINLRAIKHGHQRTTFGINDAGFFEGYMVCFSVADGEEFSYVSADAARGLANGIGGLRSDNGGPVIYLDFIRLEVGVQVWPSGLLRAFITDELWAAELDVDITTVVATAATAQHETFSYDPNLIRVQAIAFFNRIR
jgi:hypothetical protein